jgi:hypothetical protein
MCELALAQAHLKPHKIMRIDLVEPASEVPSGDPNIELEGQEVQDIPECLGCEEDHPAAMKCIECPGAAPLCAAAFKKIHAFEIAHHKVLPSSTPEFTTVSRSCSSKLLRRSRSSHLRFLVVMFGDSASETRSPPAMCVTSADPFAKTAFPLYIQAN